MQLGGIHLSGLESGVRLKSSVSDATSSHAASPADGSFAETLKAELPSRSNQTSTLVPATRTSLSNEQASQALREAWKAHFGEEPREETVAVLTAQWSHETGGGASMYNYNFGGIKGTGPSGLTVSQRTKEGWGESETTIRDNFRAYRSASEGAHDYLGLLRRRYSGALEAAHRGDPLGFVQGLKKNGYFTGNENAYARSVTQKTAQLLGHAPEIRNDQLPRGVPAQAEFFQMPAPRLQYVTQGATQASAATPNGTPARSTTSHVQAGDIRRYPPNALNVNAFDDVLSRAALQIALDTPNAFRNSRKEQG